MHGRSAIQNTHDYLCVGPIGSRNGYTTFAKSKNGIYVACGCFEGEIEEFEQRVTKTHGGSIHGENYKAVMLLARTVLGETIKTKKE